MLISWRMFMSIVLRRLTRTRALSLSSTKIRLLVSVSDMIFLPGVRKGVIRLVACLVSMNRSR